MMSKNQNEQELKPGVGFTDEANSGTDPRYEQERAMTSGLPDSVEEATRTMPVVGGEPDERTEAPSKSSEETGNLTDGSADDVLKRVAGDPEKAKAALDEEAKGQQRKGLTADLEKIVADAEEAEKGDSSK